MSFVLEQNNRNTKHTCLHSTPVSVMRLRGVQLNTYVLISLPEMSQVPTHSWGGGGPCHPSWQRSWEVIFRHTRPRFCHSKWGESCKPEMTLWRLDYESEIEQSGENFTN